ncbi:MAG: GNAT family N-acetyltransferase [Chloroflexota bacterium]
MLTIRATTATDLPALAHLWHEKLLLQAQARTKPAPDARERWASAALGWLGETRCGFFSAERDGEIVGYIVGWLQPMAGVMPEQIGLISEIAIDAHGYHGGAGRELVSALRQWCASQGVTQMVVWTPHYDAVAQAFWRSLGAAEWMDVLWIK